MNLHPLRDEADYDRALAEIDSLMGRDLGSADADRLDLLVTLVGAYEARTWPVDLPDPVAAIRFAMEQRDVDREALAGILGSHGAVDDVLERRRPLSLEMIRRLHDRLGTPAEVLIRDYALVQPAA